MTNVLQLLDIRDNPVFHRFRRSQLRTKKSIFWYLITLIVTTFAITLPYILQTTDDRLSAEAAARNLWIPLLIIQGIILLLKGTGRTAAGLIQDKIDETLDYQRLTPVSPLRNIVGYLFGIPILEYVMFALTLPHLAFIVIKGNIPLGTVFSVYLIFFTCAIFYHMTAIAVGLVMKRWIFGYLLSMFSVFFLNAVLPGIASQFGLKFLQFLSVVPVIGQKVLPLAAGPNFNQPPGQFGGPPGQFGPGPNEAEFFSFDAPVPFFDWTLSPFVFTLVLQSMLIVTFATMSIRRWKKENKHSLSKIYALGVLVVFIVLVTGNLWPVITAQYLPFAIFGETNIDELSEILALTLPMVYSLAIWLLCAFLFFNVVPTHSDYIRGIRRAKKLNRKAALPWDDDSANIAFMSLFVVIPVIGFWILYSQMQSADYMAFLDGTGFPHWRLPFVLGLVLFYSFMLLQVLENRGMVLTVLLLWLLPILVAIVSAAAIQDFTNFQSIVSSLSPIATLVMAGLLPGAWVAPFGAADDEIRVLLTGVRAGQLFLLVQIALLSFRWTQLKKKLL
jgi:hypothetical protein